MALKPTDEQILQEIVDKNGDCLSAPRCHQCPFRSMCLPEFLVPTPPTEQERLSMAKKVLTHAALLDDEETLDIKKEYKWPSKAQE